MHRQFGGADECAGRSHQGGRHLWTSDRVARACCMAGRAKKMKTPLRRRAGNPDREAQPRPPDCLRRRTRHPCHRTDCERRIRQEHGNSQSLPRFPPFSGPRRTADLPALVRVHLVDARRVHSRSVIAQSECTNRCAAIGLVPAKAPLVIGNDPLRLSVSAS